MTNGLNETQVKVLTWVVYALIFILTTVTAWQHIEIYNMPEKFVRLERYQADTESRVNALIRIENKVDQLLMKQAEK